MKKSTKNTILTCSLGYLLIILSSLALTFAVRTGMSIYHTIRFITIGIVTLRLSEIHTAFLAAPLVVAIPVMTALNKTTMDKRNKAAISLASYYILTTLIFKIKGAGEFPYITAMIWTGWVFILGRITPGLLDRIQNPPAVEI